MARSVADTRTRRPYDNSRRREGAAGTRRQIIDAGCEIVQESDVRDWRGLTVAAVAARAGVSERTVYRHFASEFTLRDAVMHSMEQRAGIDLANLTLDGVSDATVRILEQVAGFRKTASAQLDPMLSATHTRQREALLAAVAGAAPQWAEHDRVVAAAVLDVLWSVAAYERVSGDWQLSHGEATRAITWAIGLVEAAVRDGTRPAH